MVGSLMLVVAEFTALAKVTTTAQRAPIATLSTGGHHSYAMLPLALLALGFSAGVWRSRNRLALLAIGVLGLVALLIGLLGDLPDAQASGLIGSAATRFAFATSTPSIGLYLETLAAVLLLITAAGGLLLLAPPPRPGVRRPVPRAGEDG